MFKKILINSYASREATWSISLHGVSNKRWITTSISFSKLNSKRNSYFSYSRGYGSKELITTTPFKFFKSFSVRSQKNADLSELLPLRLVQKYIHQIEMEHKGWTCFKAPYIPCHGMTMLSWDVFFQCLFTT